MRDIFPVLWIVLAGFIKQEECNPASDNETDKTLPSSQTLENTNIFDSACDQDVRSLACPCFERNFKINQIGLVRCNLVGERPFKVLFGGCQL